MFRVNVNMITNNAHLPLVIFKKKENAHESTSYNQSLWMEREARGNFFFFFGRTIVISVKYVVIGLGFKHGRYSESSSKIHFALLLFLRTLLKVRFFVFNGHCPLIIK